MNKKKHFIIITAILLVLSFLPFVNSEAGWLCSSMGNNMNRSSFPRSTYKTMVKADLPNRKWTVEEIFKKSLAFTTYYGEGESDWLYSNKVDRGENRWGSDWSEATVQDNLKSARGLSCVFGGGDLFSNVGLGISSGIAGLIGGFMNNFIGEDFMVEALVKIIGGTGNNDGLISIFLHSIYAPLIVIAFMITGATIVYKGLIQMKFREALSSLIWSVGAFVVGLMLMLTPNLLVKAPQAITSTITTCVLGALSGQNCLTGEVVTPSLLAGKECLSTIEGDSNGADMMVNGMSCTIWKTFVLEPWAEEQFGVPYKDLYTLNAPEGGSIWDGPIKDGKDYCVNLSSSQSASASRGSIVMDRNNDSTVCNVALYQLYLMTAMEDPINHPEGYSLTTDYDKSDVPYDERWYDIIVPMAKHSSNWDNWTGKGRLLGRIGSANVSIIAVIAASSVLITLSIFGAAYKITAVIMMAFAPLFFLFAVEPTRGKRIFLGWLETFVSSLLKYFAIAILAIVSLVLYAGVLATTSGATSIISVIILTAALLMYRKEVVDLIGASNMGGQRLSNKAAKLSNKAAKSLEWANKQRKEKGAALVGGAIGGMVGANKTRANDLQMRNENIKDLQTQLSKATKEDDTERVKILERAIEDEVQKRKEAKSISKTISTTAEGLGHGAGDSLNRAMRRGTSITATAFKQMKMTDTVLNKRYAAAREEERLRLENEIRDPDDNGPDNGNPNGPNTPGPNNPNTPGSNNNRVNEQRDNLEYNGNLTPNEKQALDNFANLLMSNTDDDLYNLSNDDNILADDNKRRVVANEINARLRANTLDGQVSNPALFNNNLANIKSLSGSEITLLMNLERADYINTGNQASFNNYRSLLGEHQSRDLITSDEVKTQLEEANQYRNVARNGATNIDSGYKSIPELEKLRKENPEEYERYMKEDVFQTSSETKGIAPELLNRENQRLENNNNKNAGKQEENNKPPTTQGTKPAQPNNNGQPKKPVDETKVDETKVDETKVDETKVDETNQPKQNTTQTNIPNSTINKGQEIPTETKSTVGNNNKDNSNIDKTVESENSEDNTRRSTIITPNSDNSHKMPETTQDRSVNKDKMETSKPEVNNSTRNIDNSQEPSISHNERKNKTVEELKDEINKKADQNNKGNVDWEDEFGDETKDNTPDDKENLVDINDFYDNLDDYLK